MIIYACVNDVIVEFALGLEVRIISINDIKCRASMLTSNSEILFGNIFFANRHSQVDCVK